MKKRNIFIISAVCAVVAIAAAVAGNWYITYRKPNVAREYVLLVHRDTPFGTIEDSLLSSGAIKNPKSLMRAVRKKELEKHFEPGRYVLQPEMSNQYIIRMLANGWETPAKVTLRGYIKTLDKLAAFLGRNFEADSASFSATLHDSALVSSLGFKPETFIGMFIPNTYEFYWTSSPESVVKRFKKEYDRFWEGERDRLAKSIGLDRNEVMTLASIVIGETNNAGEMPRIAGVYMNRLHRGMRLQACPTVIFAHLDTEPGIRRLLKRHLKIDSPYNTYKVKGLPPGPIAIPTVTAIDAVLHYEKSDYLYFCAKPEFDGTHNFATTYSEHMRNSRAYNKAFEAREKSRKASNAA